MGLQKPATNRKPENMRVLERSPKKLHREEPKATRETFLQYPEEFSEEGKKIYETLSKVGADDKILALIDSPLLIAYCETWVKWKAAITLGAEQVYTTKTGSLAVHPAVWIANAATKTLIKMASELGCSPVGRARLAIELMGAEEEWDEYVKKKITKLNELQRRKASGDKEEIEEF